MANGFLNGGEFAMIRFLTIFAISLGFFVPVVRASGAPAPPPAQVAQRLEACEHRLAMYKSALLAEKKLRDDVKANRIYLINEPGWRRGIFRTWNTPVSVDELKLVWAVALYTGESSVAQVAELVRAIKSETADNLSKLEDEIVVLTRLVASKDAACNKLRSVGLKPALPSAGGTFALDASLTEVHNPNAPALKDVDPGAGSAVWDHTGPYGDGGNGGDWNVKYTWQVPRTLTAGRNATIKLGLTVTDVNPVQAIGFGIGALAPDFSENLKIQYPDKSGDSATYTLPIAADQASAKEILITIRFVSAEVVYHYRHQ